MRVLRSLTHSLTAAATLLVGVSSSLVAQRSGERELFAWTGAVDREIRIAMRDKDVWSRSIDRNQDMRTGSRVISPLPRNDGVVSVRLVDGRGNVDVTQQPSASNDYTTIIRIRDDAGGSDVYRVAAYWASNGYGYDRDSRVPRVEDRGRDNGGWSDGRGDDRGYGNGNGNGNSNGNGNGNGNLNGRGDRDGYRDNGSLHWSGAVDGLTEIRIRQRDVNYRTLSGNRPRDMQTRLSGSTLSRRNEMVAVRDARGRGNVTVVQQPSRSNDYTAIIRVNDPQSGYGRYDFNVVWR